MVSRSDVISAAEQYIERGVAIVPADRSTKGTYLDDWANNPITTFDRIQEFEAPNIYIGISCGHDQREVADYDEVGLFPNFEVLFLDCCPQWRELFLLLPLVKTQSNHVHLHYRLEDGCIPQKSKIALRKIPIIAADGTKKFTRIETLGKGSMAISPPTPGYEQIRGLPFWETPIIPRAMHEAILVIAKTFDERDPEEHHIPKSTMAANGSVERPGDWYNTQGESWDELLQRNGWVCVRVRGDKQYWRRPGKTDGISGTLGFCGNYFYAFSSSTDLDRVGAFSKFAFYAQYEHGGDYKAAAKAVAHLMPEELRKKSKAKLHVVSDDEPLDDDDIVHVTNECKFKFPIESFSGWALEYIKAVSYVTQTPVELCSALVLSALSISAPTVVKINKSWEEPCNIYTCTALEPGERKTAVFKLATEPLFIWQEQRKKDLSAFIEEQKQELEMLVLRRERAKAESAKKDRAERQEYEQQVRDYTKDITNFKIRHADRVLTEDVTVEKLSEMMSKDSHLAVMASEGGGPFQMMAGRYGKNVNLDIYLKGHSGDPCSTDRLGRESVYIERPLLSVALTVQPSVISSLGEIDGARSKGLFARFMFSIPKGMIGDRIVHDESVPEIIKAEYNKRITQFLDESRPIADGGCVEKVLDFDTAAKELFMIFRNTIEGRMRIGGDLFDIRDWASKAAGLLARLAGLLAISDGVDKVTAPILNRAIGLLDYYTEQARIALTQITAGKDDSATFVVLDWIKGKHGVPVAVRDIHRSMKAKFKTAEEIRQIIIELVQRGSVNEEEIKTKGRSVLKYTVKPDKKDDN